MNGVIWEEVEKHSAFFKNIPIYIHSSISLYQSKNLRPKILRPWIIKGLIKSSKTE